MADFKISDPIARIAIVKIGAAAPPVKAVNAIGATARKSPLKKPIFFLLAKNAYWMADYISDPPTSLHALSLIGVIPGIGKMFI
jgi:hypothetical protein